MYWPPLSYLTSRLQAPAGYTLDQLASDEVEDLCVAVGRWFPEMRVGGEKCHLTSEFYLTKTQLRDRPEDQRIFPITVKHQGKIVSLNTVVKDRDDLTVTARMSVVDPEHRGAGLGHMIPALVETLGRGAGAELAYYFTTLRIPHEQVIAERAGYRLVGILPASDREILSDGSIQRVPEARYAKVLVDENTVFAPPPEALTENTRRVWKFLFGN